MTTVIALKHEMAVMDETGDTKLIWDEDNDVEVEAARTMFNSLKKKGYAGYAVNKNGDKGTLLTEFDPSAEKIIMAPQMKGG
jgi:hypothetical protein